MNSAMNILLIAPAFFGYEKAILEDLEKRYNKVIYRNEIPVNSSHKWYRIKVKSPTQAEDLREMLNRYLISTVQIEQIDIVLIIRGEGLLPIFFEKVKTINPALKIIHYQWDTLSSHPYGLMIRHYADRNYSFDIADCDRYHDFLHLPIFYTWRGIDETTLLSDKMKRDIDLLCVGTDHSDRGIIVAKARQDIEKHAMKLYSHLYILPVDFLKKTVKKIFLSEYLNFKDVHITKVPPIGYYKLLCRSKAVLDIPQPNQTGASIRIMEALSLGRKVVTTSDMLKRESFYSEKNIQIWDTNTQLDITGLLSESFDHSIDSNLLTVSQWLQRMGI